MSDRWMREVACDTCAPEVFWGCDSASGDPSHHRRVGPWRHRIRARRSMRGE